MAELLAKWLNEEISLSQVCTLINWLTTLPCVSSLLKMMAL